jgi:trypsin
MRRISDNVLIGVTSFGIGCAEAGYPGVYAKIISVRDWIREIASV